MILLLIVYTFSSFAILRKKRKEATDLRIPNAYSTIDEIVVF